MVDETTELVVGYETPEGKAYRRKYLWALASYVRLVYYHYNNGSRASDAAKTFL